MSFFDIDDDTVEDVALRALQRDRLRQVDDRAFDLVHESTRITHDLGQRRERCPQVVRWLAIGGEREQDGVHVAVGEPAQGRRDVRVLSGDRTVDGRRALGPVEHVVPGPAEGLGRLLQEGDMVGILRVERRDEVGIRDVLGEARLRPRAVARRRPTV